MPTFLTPQQYIQFTKVHLYRKANSDQKRWLNFGWQHTLIICGWALEVKLKVQRYRKNICEYGIMRHNAPLQRHVKTPQPIVLFFFCECIKSFSLSLWFISFVSLWSFCFSWWSLFITLWFRCVFSYSCFLSVVILDFFMVIFLLHVFPWALCLAGIYRNGYEY